MIKTKIERFTSRRRCTLIGVGPVSKNTVDATIELANEHDVPLMLIASRRQIECEEMGGGYVNRWSTERFAEYVFGQDKKGKVVLARDHGGPWQNQIEKDERYSFRRAMDSAKRSYRADIESGFEIVHIDPSVDIFEPSSVDEILLRVFELYEFCWQVAQENKREILFEIGTDEQSAGTGSLEQFEYVLSETLRFCDKSGFSRPSFFVAQTGTKVMETRNVGTFDSPFRIEGELPAEILLPKILDICNKFGIMLKEHNADYLSDESLLLHPKLGIHSANVAPEFGVVETRALLTLLAENSLTKERDAFLKLSYDSRKWEKWMLPNTKASDFDRSVISGHYVFSDPRCTEIKKSAQAALEKKGICLEEHLKNQVKASILRYLKNFRLTRLV